MNNTKRVIGLRDKIPNINSNTEMSTYQKQVKTLRDDLHKTPIQSTTPQVKDDPRTKTSIFKSGLFEDGWQFGDLTKTILGTTGDIALDVTKGIAGIGEGLTKAARYGIAAIADTFGASEYADDVRKHAEMDVINTILDPLDNYVEQASVLGDTVDGIVQSLGYMGGILATGGLGAAAGLGTGAVTALTTGTTFASSFGNNAAEAYKEGATNDEAMKYGLISGLAEAGTELLFGGMGKLVNAKGLSTGITSVDDIIASKVSNVFKSQLGKNLSQFTVKAGAEGIEEVLSGMIQGMGQYITYKTKEDGYTLDQIMQDQRLLEQFISGAIVSGIFQTPSLIQSTRSGRDFVTGLTKTEEAELVKNTNEVISEIETKTNQKLTNDQKNNIKRELTSRLAIDVNLNDVLTKTGITSDSINNMKDLGTVDAALDVLNDLYTQFVPADKLAQHINSDIYTRIVELETKRTDIINQMNEQDKLNIKKELEAQKSETTNSIKQASIDNEIEQINDSIDKNEAIPVMKNNTYVTQHSVDLLNTAQTLLDERGFDGTIMTDLTKDQLRIEELGSMFGKKVVFLDGADFSGVTLPENSEIIFINKKINSGLLTNTKNKNKMLYTLGHELYHSLKIDNPAVYNEFINYIKSDITTEQITEFMTNYDSADTDKFYETLHINGKFDLQEILNNPKKYKVQNESLNRIVEEMVANEFGGMITDAEYMQNLQSKNPTLFDKIVDTIRKILDTLTKPIYKSSLTQLQITDIRNQFETIVSQVKSGQTLSDVKPDTKQVEVEKPVDKTVVEDTKPAKKVEDIGKETTTTKLDADTWFSNIQKMYDNYTNQTDTKRKNDTLKSVIKAYENYKKQGGTNTISELDTILSSEDYKASQQKAEATKKADFKEKLKAQLDIRKLPSNTITDNQGRTLSKQQQEYFKDSKVRDENGKLVTLYHGTPNAVFTTIKDILWLTDVRSIASDYAGSNVLYDKNAPLSSTTDILTTDGKSQYYKKVYDIKKDLYNYTFNDLIALVNYIDDNNTLLDAIEEFELDRRTPIKNISDESAQDLADEIVNSFLSNYTDSDILPIALLPSEKSTQKFTQNRKIYSGYANITNPYILNKNKTKIMPSEITYAKQNGYDGIIAYNTGEGRGNKIGNTYIIFDSNQFKLADNTTPTTSNDIRKLPTKTSKFAENISTTGAFSDLIDYATKNQNITQYESTTHKVDTDKAIQKIRDNATGAIQDFFSKPSTQLDSVDSAMGEILLNFYKSKKDINSELAVYNKLREAGTASGQFIESLKRFKQLSPAATVLGIEQDLQRAYDEMRTSTDKTIVAWMNANADKARLTDAERKWIYQMVEKASKYDVESREYELTYALINSFIADRIPKTFTNKLKTFRRLSMLFNPKTQLRNFGGNAIMVPVNIGSDFIGASLDKYLSKKYDTSRTLGKFNEGGNTGKSFVKGLQIATEDYKLGVKTSDVGTGYDLPQGQTFNKDTRTGRALNWVEKMTNYLLDLGDRGFTQMYYDNSLNNQMKLAGVTEATDTMKQIAMEEAAKKTWKNDSKLAQIASSARNTLNKVHIGELGLGDIVIPFVMTPANLAVATYEYSPAAALSVYNNAKKFNEAVKSGKDIALAQKNLVDSFGKATMGTLLYAIAFAAAKKGLITGDEDEDKDIRNLMRAQGFQPFSIKIGDTSYTYDWMQPIASPFAVMTELERTTQLTGEKQSIFEAIVKAFSIGGSRLEEQSFLSSLKTLFSGDDMISGLINVGMSVPASFIPTLFNQVGTLIDSNSKYTYDKNPLKSMLYQAAVKIPGVKSLLPNRVNVLGQDIEMYSGKNNIFNVMLNAANVSSDVAGEVGNEIMNVYNHTGESSIIPSVTSTYIDYTVDGNKKRINLSLEQQSELQKLMGTIAYNAISEMMLSDTYNSASYDEKATALTSLVSYAKAKAIEESGFAEGYSIKGGDALQINNYINKGLSISNAVMYDSIINTANKGSENGQKAYIIMNMPIGDDQKNIMLQLISPKATRPETVDTLSNLQSEQDFIDYYSLSRSDYFVQNKFSRDDYDSAVNYYGFTGTQFIEYVNELTNIKSDYNANGEVISNSKKNKTISYIESLPLTAIQKVYLYGMAGYSVKAYRNQLFEYINSLNISVDEKNTLWKNLGF